MRLGVLCMGRTRERFIRDGIEKYVRYLQPYAPTEVRELREERIGDLKDAPRVRRKEAERIVKALVPGGHVVALDERGREFTSHEFASFINDRVDAGAKDMTFIIGGAMGLDESITGSANTVLAIARWTVTHEMARLVLLEQLYRAFTIIRGKTYHY